MPENQLKWQWVRRSPDTFDFRAFDAIADYATRQGFKLRGHTLFWTPTKWYPKWLAERQFKSAAEAEQLLAEHVRTVCRRYGDRIYSYDVVNEAVQPETGAIRDTNVTRALGGEAFLDLMFHTARAEAPHAELVYNDYMSWELTGEDQMHTRQACSNCSKASASAERRSIRSACSRTSVCSRTRRSPTSSASPKVRGGASSMQVVAWATSC